MGNYANPKCDLEWMNYPQTLPSELQENSLISVLVFVNAVYYTQG